MAAWIFLFEHGVHPFVLFSQIPLTRFLPFFSASLLPLLSSGGSFANLAHCRGSLTSLLPCFSDHLKANPQSCNRPRVKPPLKNARFTEPCFFITVSLCLAIPCRVECDIQSVTRSAAQKTVLANNVVNCH